MWYFSCCWNVAKVEILTTMFYIHVIWSFIFVIYFIFMLYVKIYVYYVFTCISFFLNFAIYFYFDIIWFRICAITFLFLLYAQFLLRKKYFCYNGSNFLCYIKNFIIWFSHDIRLVKSDPQFVFKMELLYSSWTIKDGCFWNYNYRVKSFDYFRKKVHLRQLSGT